MTHEDVPFFTPFLASLAAAYELPALAYAALSLKENNTLRAEVECQPTGQLSLIVRTLQARITIWEANGIYHAEVKLSYEHWGSGSNGAARMFLVYSKPQYTGEPREYAGYICDHTYRETFSHLDAYTRRQRQTVPDRKSVV